MPLRVMTGPKPHILSPIRRGLVAEYLFFEGSGSTLHDTSGYGNHGTINNPEWIQLENGKWVLRHTSTNNCYVDGPDRTVKPEIAPDYAWIEVLFRPLVVGRAHLVHLWDGYAFAIRDFDGDGHYEIIALLAVRHPNGVATEAIPRTSFTEEALHAENYLGRWVHLISGFSGKDYKQYVYLNGELVKVGDPHPVGTKMHYGYCVVMRIGRSCPKYNVQSEGVDIALVRIWNRARLSDREVKKLYEHARSLIPELG